jgi:hypothetical protein
MLGRWILAGLNQPVHWLMVLRHYLLVVEHMVYSYVDIMPYGSGPWIRGFLGFLTNPHNVYYYAIFLVNNFTDLQSRNPELNLEVPMTSSGLQYSSSRCSVATCRSSITL